MPAATGTCPPWTARGWLASLRRLSLTRMGIVTFHTSTTRIPRSSITRAPERHHPTAVPVAAPAEGTTIQANAHIWTSCRAPGLTTVARTKPNGPTAWTSSMRMHITLVWRQACTIGTSASTMQTATCQPSTRMECSKSMTMMQAAITTSTSGTLRPQICLLGSTLGGMAFRITPWASANGPTTRLLSLTRPPRSPALNSKPSGCNNTTTPKRRL